MTGSERIVLTERDRRLLEYVYRFRLLSRDQVMALAQFRSLTRANTRLGALVRAGVLKRKTLPVYPGHGDAQALYYLGRASRLFLTLDDSVISQLVRQVSRWDLSQVEHVRAANQALIALVSCLDGVNALATSFRTEPELRRRFLDHALVPDAWVEWTFQARRYNCFLEIDLHHEGLHVWREKVLAYLAYAESGLHQEHFGYQAFRVLVLAGSAKRLEGLRHAASAAGRLFLFAETGNLSPEAAISPIWQPTSDSKPIPLMEA